MAARTKKKPVVQELTVPANAKVVPEGERRCPICQATMQTTSRNGETIDVCAAHGVWLDRFELERMFLRRARRTGVRLRRVAAGARAAGHADGFFWGVVMPL